MQTRTLAALADALAEVRDAVGSATFPLELPQAGPARHEARRLVTQLDDHLIPRARRLDASLLAVVGGSTGAGKSTLVNSLVRAPVSPAGVLRPTTREPVLVCHPGDTGRFPGVDHAVSAPHLPPGIALLDAPDLDSVVVANRARAWRLLDAADLWIFVTTAARYADAVPWAALHTARDRGTAIGIVLDRVPTEVSHDIAEHFAAMLGSQGLGDAPLFVVPEAGLDPYVLLPESRVAGLHRWLAEVAVDRDRVARATLAGSLATLDGRLARLADAADDQVAADAAATAETQAAHAKARARLAETLDAGDLLRGPVWASLVQADRDNELRQARRAIDTRDRRPGRPNRQAPPGRRVLAAIEAAVTDLLTMLQPRPALTAAPASPVEAAQGLVREWQGWLRDTASALPARSPIGADSRAGAALRVRRCASTVLLASIAAIAPSGRHAPSLLRELVTDPTIAALGAAARARLIDLADGLLAAPTPAADVAPVDLELPARLRWAGHHLRLATLAPAAPAPAALAPAALALAALAPATLALPAELDEVA